MRSYGNPFLYGSGLRLREALQLRIKDIDFAQHQLIIRDAKGGESRVTLLPARSIEPLQHHLEQVQKLHTQDLNSGYGTTQLPFAYTHVLNRGAQGVISPLDITS